MTEIKLYFPSTILLQYVNVTTIKELNQRLKKGSIGLLRTLLRRNPIEDVHTTVTMPYNLVKYFKGLRDKLVKLVLGKDVILFYKIDEPIELTAEEEYELVLDLEPELVNRMKIRKYAVAERFLITDMVFRLFYSLSEVLKLTKELRKLKKKITTFEQSKKYDLLLSDYAPFTRPGYRTVLNLHYPHALSGFISSNFPLLSKSGVFQLAIMLHVKERRFTDFFEEHPYFDDFESFVEECSLYYDEAVTTYRKQLSRFIKDLKRVLEEKDPLEEFILSNLPSTFFDIYIKAVQEGYDGDDVVLKLRDLVRRGIIVESDGLIKKVEL